METFIQSSSDLLEAYPGATVSITYANVAKKLQKEDLKRASNVVKFKVHDAKLGKSIQYLTYKSKELSRILTYLGPRGVSMKRKNEETEATEKKQKLSVGAASVMSNTKIEEEEPTPASENEKQSTPAVEEPTSTKSSKKKKKNKKK